MASFEWPSDGQTKRQGVLLATGAPPTGTVNSSFNTVIYGTEVTDTASAYNPATGVFTAPYDMYATITAAVTGTGTFVATAVIGVQVYIDNTTSRSENYVRAYGANGTIWAQTSVSLSLSSGQTVRIRGANEATGAGWSSASANNFFSINFREQ